MISITHTHKVDTSVSSVNNNNNYTQQRTHNTFLSLPKTTSPPHTFLSKKRITQPASSLLSPSTTTPVHFTTKAKLIPKSSITMYKHIILKTKEYYDKAITEERNQGIINSPIRITKNDDNVVLSSSSSSYMLLSSNCNVKRNLMDYFNGGNSQCNGMNSKSRCLPCNGGNGEFKQKSLRDFFKR